MCYARIYDYFENTASIDGKCLYFTDRVLMYLTRAGDDGEGRMRVHENGSS